MIRITELAMQQVTAVLRPGDCAVDATAGNGIDTLFLAGRVGPGGHVYAFDIQAEALARTMEKLRSEKLQDRVTLIRAGHEHIYDHVSSPVSAAMFNLGYLPGGDHRIITHPRTTVTAVGKALELLRPGGIVTVAIYPGHHGGREEKDTLLQYCAGLCAGGYRVVHSAVMNIKKSPPELLAIYRRTGDGREPDL